MPRIFLERRELGDDLKRLVDVLERESFAAGATGECNPPVDVIDSPTAVSIVMDLPGVPAASVQVVLSRGTVLIAGTKVPASCGHKDAAFHLAERTFGRFARIVRLAGAVVGGRAKATLTAGELRIEFPRIEERRGRQLRIPIAAS
jgi:HSP20 family protein